MNCERIGILWRGDRDASASTNRLFDPLAKALADLGVTAVPVPFAEDAIPEVRKKLVTLGALLVWVDPISEGRDRLQLDALLREVAASGVQVSAHPDVISKLGTKEVLFRTRSLGWGTDTRLYSNFDEFCADFPNALGSAGPRVLKQNRGNGGIGVFRVDLVQAARRPGTDAPVWVQHARRGSAREKLSLGEFRQRCAGIFAN